MDYTTDQEGGRWEFSRVADADGDIHYETKTYVGEGVYNVTSYTDHTDSSGAYTSDITGPAGAVTAFTRPSDGMKAEKSLPCGSELVFEYDTDPQYQTKYVKKVTETAPSGLTKVAERDRTYQDADSDGTPEIITETVTVNKSKTTTFAHDVTQAKKTVTSLRGELLRVDLPDGRVIEYVHDPLDRRIAKKVDGVITEKYLWQGLTRLLAVYDGADNLLMRFEYADSRMPVAMTKAGVTYYFGYDQAGSLKAVADASGSVVKRIEYDTFGNILSDSNPAFEVPFGFAGGLNDRDTGLVRFGHRDYDPETGRWTAKDPILFAGGDTDLYGYCLNDPVNFIDPNGLEFWSAFGQGVADGVIGAAIVAGITAAAIAVVPTAATAITEGLFVAGLAGGMSSVYSMASNRCPDNIGYNLGAFTGGAIVGGLTGGFFNAKLSPPGQASPPGLKGWSLKRELTLGWDYEPSLTPKQNWNKAMGTGPTKLSAAGSVAAAGSGFATDGPCNSCF